MDIAQLTALGSSSADAHSQLYDRDFYAWLQVQIQLLRSGQLSALDIPNLIEELDALGKRDRRELRSRLGVLLGNLLKWEYQSERRSRSWLATIRIQRREIQQLLKDSPSLKPYANEILPESYENGRDLAMGETGLSPAAFPAECQYSMEQLFNASFFPGDPSDWLE